MFHNEEFCFSCFSSNATGLSYVKKQQYCGNICGNGLHDCQGKSSPDMIFFKVKDLHT